MSAKGNCFDNAVAASFFATLKLEAVKGKVYNTKQAAHQHLFDFIECFITANDCTPALITVALSSAPLSYTYS
jgi:transposase InsO family protein